MATVLMKIQEIGINCPCPVTLGVKVAMVALFLLSLLLPGVGTLAFSTGFSLEKGVIVATKELKSAEEGVNLGFNASEVGPLSAQGWARCMVALMEMAEVAETEGILAVEAVGFDTATVSFDWAPVPERVNKGCWI